MTMHADLSLVEAKAIIAARLHELSLPAYRLTARTIDFTDLARASMVFVKIHGWQPDGAAWTDLERTAHAHGFRLTAD